MANALDYNRNFESKVIANTADDIFTLAAGILRNMVVLISNDTASPVTLQGWVIPSGGSAAAANKFIATESIAANTSMQFGIPKMITGDKLTLQAGTASALTVFEDDAVVLV